MSNLLRQTPFTTRALLAFASTLASLPIRNCFSP